ncbi:MAG TPA: hypothetical protein VFM62_00840 [Arthrobacter sp.]|nr:hypothetical protein [Arthrobacter sp.]
MAQVHGVDDRPRLRRVLAAVCLISGLPAVILTCVRLLPFGLPTPFVQLISLTPYLLLPLTIAMVAAFALRWWTGGSILIAAMLLQLLWLVPAWTGVEPAAEPVSQGGSAGTSSTEVLDVMALNALYGRAEAGPIVKTAREQGIDVLVIAEFDKDLSRRLDAAGISGPLPY